MSAAFYAAAYKHDRRFRSRCRMPSPGEITKIISEVIEKHRPAIVANVTAHNALYNHLADAMRYDYWTPLPPPKPWWYRALEWLTKKAPERGPYLLDGPWTVR